MQQWVSLGCRYCPSWHCTCLFSLLKGLERSLPSKATRWICSIYGTGAISTDSFVNTQTNVRITCKYRGRGKRDGKNGEQQGEKTSYPLADCTADFHLQLDFFYNIEFNWLDQFWYQDLPLTKACGEIIHQKNPPTNLYLSSVLLIRHTMVSVTNWLYIKQIFFLKCNL